MSVEHIVNQIASYSPHRLDEYFRSISLITVHKIKEYLDSIYYRSGESPFLDSQYEIIIDVLNERDPEYVPPIGSKLVEESEDVKLPYFLGSMNKDTQGKTVKLEKFLREFPGPYIVQDKMDGVSCLTIFDGRSVRMFTRGDGSKGKDISHYAKYFRHIPKGISGLAVRGELIMNDKVFNDKYEDDYANPRNLVSGVTGAKTAREALLDIDFVAYEILDRDNQTSPSQQLIELTGLGFKVPNYSITRKLTPESLASMFSEHINKSSYTIDGLIVQSDRPYIRNTFGNPDYAFAFKMILDSIETEVEEVLWTIVKSGQIRPRVQVKPVKLSGATITYATAFNAKYVVDNDIGPGSVIRITRSGETIPHIVEVVKGTKASLPEFIPYFWNDTRVNIMVRDTEGSEICIKLLTSFFKTLKAKHVAEQTITKMVEHGLDDLMKILGASKTELLNIPTFKEATVNRIQLGIKKALTGVTKADILGASNVLGIGIAKKKVVALLDGFPDIIEKCDKMSRGQLVDRITQIDGFSTLTAEKIADNVFKAREFLENMKPYVIYNNGLVNSDRLAGQKFVFTGFTNKDIEEAITSLSGKVVGSVSSNTTALIVSSKPPKESTKTKAAVKYGIPMYTLEEFVSSFNLDA